MKSKLVLTCVGALVIITKSFSQDWNNQAPANSSSPLFRQGKVQVGDWYMPDNPSAWYLQSPNPIAAPHLEVGNTEASGGVGTSNLLFSTSGLMGVNRMRHNTWLFRKTAGVGWWSGFVVHDGLSVDASFKQPGIDTKTWWERDAFANTQKWGNDANTYLRLENGKLCVGDLLPINAKFEVQDANDARIFAYTTSGNPSGLFALNSAGSCGIGVDGSGVAHIGLGSTVVNNFINFDWNYSTTPFQPRVWVGTRKQVNGANSDALFNVDGKLSARAVVVTQQNWADFVFDKNYELMPLTDLENFYKENRHLPEVPSTREIIEKGNDLGKTDALLLQKIEELTLYIVEQQKQIEVLKNSLKSK